jgi:hypothetical protein
VVDDRIEIVNETEDYLAVNKPASIPMHPCVFAFFSIQFYNPFLTCFVVSSCGKYRFNSLIMILAKEMQYKNLRCMHVCVRLNSSLGVSKTSKLHTILSIVSPG